MFWTEFDKEFKLVPELILSGMTSNLFKTEIKKSSFRTNDINSDDSLSMNIYHHIASTLLEDKKLENDILITTEKIGTNIHSINLNNYLSKSVLFMKKFDSFDTTYSSKYGIGEHNSNYDFSYLLGNFIRYFEKGKLIIPNDTKRLYVLTSIIENFNYRNDFAKLTISRGIESSFIELENEELLNRLYMNIEFLKTTTANNVYN